MRLLTDILRDPIWQFFFGFIAIAATIVVFRLQQNRKSIGYEVLSETSLVSLEDEVEGQIEIIFNGKSVNDVSLVVVRIINSGNVPILSTEYNQPVRFDFGKDVKIISAEILSTKPSNIDVLITAEQATVAVVPSLLNSKDSVDIKVVLSSYQGNISVSTRIVGIKSIEKLRRIGSRRSSKYMQHRLPENELLYTNIQEVIKTTLTSKEVVAELVKAMSQDTAISKGEQIGQILNNVAGKTVERIRQVGFITIDTRPLLREKGSVRQVPFDQFQTISELLDDIYFSLPRRTVPAFSYEQLWLLRDPVSGTLFTDIGRNWAEQRGQEEDERSLEAVGLKPGMIIEVVTSNIASLHY